MIADLATFRALFPEFDSVNDIRVQLYLDDASDELSESAWGKCYNKAVLYYAAHQLALSERRQFNAETDEDGHVSINKEISNASADGLSVGFEQPAIANGSSDKYWLSQTPYGQAYLALRKQCLTRMRLVSCGR